MGSDEVEVGKAEAVPLGDKAGCLIFGEAL